MGRISLLVALSCAGLAQAGAKAQDEFPNDLAARDGTVRLLPSTPWNIDFGETKCRLSRVFGSGADRHIVFFEQVAPGQDFGLTVAGPKLSAFQRSGRVSVGLRGDQPMIVIESAGRGTVGEYGPGLIFSLSLEEGEGQKGKEEPDTAVEPTFAGIDLRDARASERLVVASGKRAVSFETGLMSDPMHALNACSRDFLVQWGLDPQQHERYTPPKWINMRAIAKRLQQYYSPAALRVGEQGIFRMRVIVEADGSLAECHLESMTVTESLQSPACKEMKAAQFEPARDAEGRPIRSFYTTSITYSIN